MKKLIFTLLLLQGSMVSSQEYFSFDLYFDPSAMTTTDVNGDKQSSMNALVNVSVPIKTTDTGHFFLGQSVEYANLLDEEYYTNADLFDSVVIKPSEGRTLSFMLSYEF